LRSLISIDPSEDQAGFFGGLGVIGPSSTEQLIAVKLQNNTMVKYAGINTLNLQFLVSIVVKGKMICHQQHPLPFCDGRINSSKLYLSSEN
jgi:hypothetical protein